MFTVCFFPGCTYLDYEFIPGVITSRQCLGYIALPDKNLQCQPADPLWRLHAVTLSSGLYFTSNKLAFTYMQPIALTAYLYINIIPSAFHSWGNPASKVAGGEEGVSGSSGSKLKPCSITFFFPPSSRQTWIQLHISCMWFILCSNMDFFQSRLWFQFVDTSSAYMCNYVGLSVCYRRPTLYIMPLQTTGN